MIHAFLVFRLGFSSCFIASSIKMLTRCATSKTRLSIFRRTFLTCLVLMPCLPYLLCLLSQDAGYRAGVARCVLQFLGLLACFGWRQCVLSVRDQHLLRSSKHGSAVIIIRLHPTLGDVIFLRRPNGSKHNITQRVSAGSFRW